MNHTKGKPISKQLSSVFINAGITRDDCGILISNSGLGEMVNGGSLYNIIRNERPLSPKQKKFDAQCKAIDALMRYALRKNQGRIKAYEMNSQKIKSILNGPVT